MATISSIGVGSGLDLENLVKQIITAERAPTENRLNLKEAEVQASISAFGSLKSTLSAFQSSLSNLKNSSFYNAVSATSGNSELFTATATSSATLGNYNIKVFEQAKAHKLVAQTNFSAPTDTVGSGKLTISVGGNSFNVDITASSNDTVEGIRDAINNATDNTGVTASLLTIDNGSGGTYTKLVITADNTGENGKIAITVDDDDLADTDAAGLSQLFYTNGDVNNRMNEIDPAQQARIAVDGFTAKSSTNKFTDVIPGVTITLLDEADNVLNPPSAALNLSSNTSGISGEIQTFVASYNELVKIFNQLTNYDATTEKRGLLSGDSTVSLIESRLRRLLSEEVTGAASDFSTLAFVGISTNQDGTLSLDTKALNSAISTRTADVAKLFSGTNGAATRLDSLIGEYIGAGGIFQTREDGFKDQLSEIKDDRETLEFRLQKIEARYRSQFASLDILVQQLNQTGDFLQQQLAATAQIISSRTNK